MNSGFVCLLQLLITDNILPPMTVTRTTTIRIVARRNGCARQQTNPVEGAHSGTEHSFADGYVKRYNGYDANEMTFRYDSIHGWQ
jgi:hypothetical protein